MPWRRAWQPTPVFLLGKSHGQRSLMGYSPWGCKELDTTWQLNKNTGCTTPRVQHHVYNTTCINCGLTALCLIATAPSYLVSTLMLPQILEGQIVHSLLRKCPSPAYQHWCCRLWLPFPELLQRSHNQSASNKGLGMFHLQD